MRSLLILILTLLFSCKQEDKHTPSIQKIDSPTESLLQAISIIDNQTAWMSGHNASIVRTVDDGKNWDVYTHPTGDTLQFRDIYAFDNKNAVLMSAGPGPLSRIFKFQTPDKWEETFVMQDSLGFLDCIDFWDNQRGIAYGDAIDAYPYILLTSDGGKTWSRTDTTGMPLAGNGEGGFASSGTCVTTGENGQAWIATGAGGNCRFLLTPDYGASWIEVASPLIKGDAAGNTSVSFVGEIGLVTGGDLLKPDEYTENCAFSNDRGQTWELTQQPLTKGAFYGSTLTIVENEVHAFVCGPNGIDYTVDMGSNWSTLDKLNYWAISVKGKTGYAVGRGGNILRISLQP